MYKGAQTGSPGCSRAGFLTGVAGHGLFSVWINEDSVKSVEEEHNSTDEEAG